MENLPWRVIDNPLAIKDDADLERILDREWLVTNGLGGYASGTVAGYTSRRYHGLLVSALPAPLGRMVMLADLAEEIRLEDGTVHSFGVKDPYDKRGRLPEANLLGEFRLESGIPVWRYVLGDTVLERRIHMPHRQNTVHITYRLLARGNLVRIRLWPYLHFRSIESPVDDFPEDPYSIMVRGRSYEILSADPALPPLRMSVTSSDMPFILDEGHGREIFYRIEQGRGHDYRGKLWNPGFFRYEFRDAQEVTLMASTESWETIRALRPDEAERAERLRCGRLLDLAGGKSLDGFSRELVLAADQFLITPVTRLKDSVRALAQGDEVRTVIAGYHWFTDWGRDTMISLEGLTLTTGRQREAGYVLREFANHVKDGLIPNMFPEGNLEGLYHTADATLWFFHALDRYLYVSGDRLILRGLLPILVDIIDRHEAGTRFGIRMDRVDGLLHQGEEGYQLTWMDAKVEDWVVTPRRGKAVEINALWYNALRVMERFAGEEIGREEADRYRVMAERVWESFNRRFWFESGGYLYDVVDGEFGDDSSFRPNQIFAISLPNPVLDETKQERVVEAVRERLWTPLGLRSLAPGQKDYKDRYSGDLRSRDAAYHQGTVWGWLIGPFVDAWLKVHPGELARAREFLEGFKDHLAEAGMGSVSEIFDAEAPFTPRGCVAQAWSVAELLRVWCLTAPQEKEELKER